MLNKGERVRGWIWLELSDSIDRTTEHAFNAFNQLLGYDLLKKPLIFINENNILQHKMS